MNNLASFIFKIAVVGATMFFFFWYAVFAYGYVAIKLYGWFVQPYFPNAPVLDYVGFAGVALFLSAIFPIAPNDEIKDEFLKNEGKDHARRICLLMIKPWFLLLLGSIVQYWFK